MNKKYQVFVSSTYEDLKGERDQVIKALLEMGHIPVGMEMFSAGDEEQWQVIKRSIDDCDYYVVIIAHRYGSEVNNISFTEREYDYAIASKTPAIGLVIDDTVSWPSKFVDKDQESVEKLNKFKNKVKMKTVKFWKNSEDLYAKCSISLMKAFSLNPQVGWIKANMASSEETTQEVLKLRKDIDALNIIIKSYEQEIGESSKNYAQGFEIVKLLCKYDITDPNTSSYRRKIISNNLTAEVNVTWKSLISFMLPAIISMPTEQQFKNSLGKFVKENILIDEMKGSTPVLIENIRVSDETYNIVKVQLLALNFAELIDDSGTAKRKIFWSLTKPGQKKMYQLNAQIAEPASQPD